MVLPFFASHLDVGRTEAPRAILACPAKEHPEQELLPWLQGDDLPSPLALRVFQELEEIDDVLARVRRRNAGRARGQLLGRAGGALSLGGSTGTREWCH